MVDNDNLKTYNKNIYGDGGIFGNLVLYRIEGSMNILVVDDEKEIADVVELYLQNDQYKVFKFITPGCTGLYQ